MARNLYCGMQAVLHIYDSLANCHMQAGLQGLQQNLHNVFATRIDSQSSLQFFALDFFALDFFAISVAFFCVGLWALWMTSRVQRTVKRIFTLS